MQTIRTTSRRARARRPRPRAKRRRRSAFWVLLELFVVAALAGGAYIAADRLIFHPHNAALRADDVDVTDLDPNPPLEEWQSQGTEGWERLFQEASKGLPGYKVDTGAPARRKLIELGDKVRPLALRKLAEPEFAVRINAICILAHTGEPPARVHTLLDRELRQAATAHDGFAVLKCAAVLPSSEPIIVKLSLLALGSSHANTRRQAIDNLSQLRGHPAAPPDLVARLLALLDDQDEQIRLLVAARFAREGAPRTYRVLLDSINSGDRGTALKAAALTAQLRGQEAFPGTLAPRREADKAIDEQRKWLERQAR